MSGINNSDHTGLGNAFMRFVPINNSEIKNDKSITDVVVTTHSNVEGPIGKTALLAAEVGFIGVDMGGAIGKLIGLGLKDLTGIDKELPIVGICKNFGRVIGGIISFPLIPIGIISLAIAKAHVKPEAKF